MKLTTLNPKRLFRRKPRSTVSRSNPSSFTSSSSSSAANSGTTPTFVLPEISGDIRYELTQAFRLIDRDNDGIVSTADFEAVLAPLVGSAPAEEGGEVCVTVDELVDRVGSCGYPEEMRDVFGVFDVDGDGRISAEELMRVFAAIGIEGCTLEECRRMIAGVDSNGDGFVCFDDFSRMMKPFDCKREELK